MYKGDQGLDDSHEACQGILIPMERPDGLASIAQNEDMLFMLLPRMGHSQLPICRQDKA